MAFVSLLFIYLVVILAIVGTATFIGTVLLIISVIMKKRRRTEKKTYLIPRVLGLLCMIPLAFCVVVVLYSVISASIHKKTSLAYNVEHLNKAQIEKIIDRGVTPDCTMESNDAASHGDKTLLCLLAEGIYYDEWDWEFNNESEKTIHDATLDMMKLLLEKGADVNYVIYREGIDMASHGYKDTSSKYRSTDKCGWTPLMIATYRADFDMIKLLVDHGADVHAVDYCGYNVINIIADSLDDEEGYEILNYYLELGVDPNHITNYRQDSLWLATRNRAGNDSFENDQILVTLVHLK